MLNEYENDIIFAKYLTYMKKALLHKEFLKRTEQNLTQEEWVVLSVDDTTTHSSFFSQISNNEDLENALNTLTNKQKQVIYLNFFEKKTLKRIGLELNITTNAVEKLKMRAIARLKKYLEDNDGRRK